jgi:DNA primase catalytic subunit
MTIYSIHVYIIIIYSKNIRELYNKYSAVVRKRNSLNKEENKEKAVLRYCRRRVDRALKKVDLGAAVTASQLKELLQQQISDLSIEELSAYARGVIQESVTDKDLIKLLSIYDNKGLLAIASSHLKGTRRPEFEHWLIRLFNSRRVSPVIVEIKGILPVISTTHEVLPST